MIRAADQNDPKDGTTARKKQAAKPRPLITVSKETTYLTEPLTKDGFVDYAQTIDDDYRKGVTPENNFAVVLWQTFGPGEIDAEFREQMLEKLGIDSVSKDTIWRRLREAGLTYQKPEHQYYELDEEDHKTGCGMTSRKFAELEVLQSEIGMWSEKTTAKQRGVDWQFQIGDARHKLKRLYPKIKT